jgi:putative N6-adenine-specific DNA methylase
MLNLSDKIAVNIYKIGNCEMSRAKSMTMIAKTLSGLEEPLAAELTDLGASDAKPMNRSVSFKGSQLLLYKANLCSRLAMRVLVSLKRFHIAKNDDLYRTVKDIDWRAYLDPDDTLAVDSFIFNSIFNHSRYASQLVKDAIADQFRDRYGRRPSVDFDSPRVRINLYISGREAILALDSSGEPLSRRGYRLEGGEAPLSEVLTAGIIALTGWDAETPFIDGMCGSGTFVIEAAMKARRIAPGLLRKTFGFMKWKDYDAALLEKLKREAKARILPKLPFEIVGSDIDPERLAESRANARRAGVDKDIRFDCIPFKDQSPPSPPGVLVINPPYDKRMPVEDVASLYSMIGDTLKQKYKGYAAFIFTGSSEGVKNVGLRTLKRIILFNGPLECRLLRYEMYEGTRKKSRNIPAPGIIQ